VRERGSEGGDPRGSSGARGHGGGRLLWRRGGRLRGIRLPLGFEGRLGLGAQRRGRGGLVGGSARRSGRALARRAGALRGRPPVAGRSRAEGEQEGRGQRAGQVRGREWSLGGHVSHHTSSSTNTRSSKLPAAAPSCLTSARGPRSRANRGRAASVAPSGPRARAGWRARRPPP